MRKSFLLLLLALVAASPLAAKDHGKHKHHAKQVVVVSPAGLPPGLAKRFGRPVPQRVYVAFDPRNEDRAWFLIDNRWVEYRDFDAPLRVEVHNSLRMPPVPLPPVPPPIRHLHVVLFGS